MFIPRHIILDLQSRDEQIVQLELVTGLSLDKLLEMFKAGYTLAPPSNTTLEELGKMAQ